MRNVDNRNVTELAHCITVFKTNELGMYFDDTVILVWHLFSLAL